MNKGGYIGATRLENVREAFTMSTNPNPNLPYPTSSNQYSNPKADPASISKVLTFDEVSKFFTSPLSDAADSLGVCTSVVKKICHENGLESWPYRKVRAGKSIEEIRQEAAGREKSKNVKDLSSAAVQQINNASANSAGQSPYLTTSQDPTSSVPHQQGNKNPPEKGSVSNFQRGNFMGLDEFKYGFPSQGLATVSYKWWGSSDTKSSVEDGNKITENNNLDHLVGEGSLSALRKRGVKEGEEALKLGVHRKYNMNKLNPKKKALLVQIFKSSLPSQWIDE